MRLVWMATLGIALAGCGNGGPPSVPAAPSQGPGAYTPVDNSPPPQASSLDAQVLADVPVADRCDFLDEHYCLFPWPNDYFTVADSANGTGRRVNLSPLSMPKNVAGRPIDPTEWNRNDGFSPGQAILVRVPGLDAAKTGAVPITNIADSFRADQPIVVIDADTLERHPIWAELDANITKFGPCDSLKPANALLALVGSAAGVPGTDALAQQLQAAYDACRSLPLPQDPTADPGPALIVRAAKNFAEGHRYIVALRNLKDGGGKVIDAGVPFQIYRDNHASSLPMVESRRAHLEDLFKTLGRAGIDRKTLYLAWDFTVASERNLSERMLHIRDDALAGLGDAAPSFSVTGVTNYSPAQDANIARQVQGTISVPCYLSAPGCKPGARFYYAPDLAGPNPYGDGLPDVNPLTPSVSFPFTCNIPRVAFDNAADPATATGSTAVRASLYGHGLLGSQGEVNAGNVKQQAQRNGFMFCATDWWGMASGQNDPTFGDVPNVALILLDMSQFPTLADRVQQGMLNFIFLGRAMIRPDGFSKNPAFQVAGRSLIDTTELYYDGNSQGGIIGGSLVAVSPDVRAGVLGVPGMNYSTLLQRSVDFDTYAAFLYASYRASLDQQFVLSLIQMLWDRAETNGYAQHLAANEPLPNTSPKRVLLTPAFGDHQVSMWTAEVEARTLGAALHCPAVVAGPDPQRGPAVQPGAHPAVIAEQSAHPDISHGRRHPDDEPYYGIPCIAAYPYRGSALVVWDSGPTVHADGSPSDTGVAPPPIDNTPPRPSLGYGADPHEFPRSTDADMDMKSEFLKPAGAVVDTCGGKPCATRGFDPTP